VAIFVTWEPLGRRLDAVDFLVSLLESELLPDDSAYFGALVLSAGWICNCDWLSR
jgi:hypothetical protein